MSDGDDISPQIFVEGSDENHSALARLAEVFEGSGFSVRKKARSEATLRVYPRKQNQYPLLNPRFVRPGAARGVLEISVLSRREDAALDAGLESLRSETITVKLLSHTLNGFHYHGTVLIVLPARLSELSHSLSVIRQALITSTSGAAAQQQVQGPTSPPSAGPRP